MVIYGGISSNSQEESIMKKPKSEKLFGQMKPTPDMVLKSPKKKAKKIETMEEYHQKRNKKLGLV